MHSFCVCSKFGSWIQKVSCVFNCNISGKNRSVAVTQSQSRERWFVFYSCIWGIEDVERWLQLMLIVLHLSGVAAVRDEWWGGSRRGKFTPSCQWGGRAWSFHAWINTIKSALAPASPTPPVPPFLPHDASPFPPHPPPLYNSIWPGHAARWHTVGQKGSNDELLPVGVIHDDNY